MQRTVKLILWKFIFSQKLLKYCLNLDVSLKIVRLKTILPKINFVPSNNYVQNNFVSQITFINVNFESKITNLVLTGWKILNFVNKVSFDLNLLKFILWNFVKKYYWSELHFVYTRVKIVKFVVSVNFGSKIHFVN